MADALLDNPLFGRLGEEDRERLVFYLERRELAEGEVVMREGDRDRDMYLVIEGEASVRHGDLEIGIFGPGEHFGELGLVAARPRSATIVAATPLALASLSIDRFHALSADEPMLALRFVRAIVERLGVRLDQMTESVGCLLCERSLPRRVTVSVRVAGAEVPVKVGTSLRDLLPDAVNGHPVVAAMVDRRVMSLVAPISSDCAVEPLTPAHWEGRRIYRLSLGLLLLEAADTIDPALALQMEHSIGIGQRASVPSLSADRRIALAAQLETRMRELVAADLPLREELWTVAEARAHFEERGWRSAAELLTTWRDPTVPLSSFGRAYALCAGPLAATTGVLSGFRVIADDGLVLVYGKQGTAPESMNGGSLALEARTASRQANAMTRQHELWLSSLGMSSVGEFNRACLAGNVSQVIRVAEGFHEKRSSQIADEISARRDRAKVVCIAGPSSSGKSTFIRRLKVQLQVNGMHPVEVSLDNYYCDRDETPRDEAGEYDYESLGALRRDVLDEHLHALLRGEPVTTLRYDFGLGKSIDGGGRTIRLGERDILMLEGIHGLNPKLLGELPEDRIFRIFICPLAQLPFDRLARVHGSDLRLLRRIVRDRHSRGATAAQSIARWPSVRRGERRHIFPYQDHADAVFDSSLIYEISVLKVFAERYLLEVPQDAPEYTTAFRLLELCDRFVTIYPDHVPPTSLLREFIGGSGFEV